MPNKRSALKHRRAAAAAVAAQQQQEDTEMQINLVDNSPEEDFLTQPAKITAPTLFLDHSLTDDGQHYVTSLFKCQTTAEVFEWGKKNTGVQNATVQAFKAIEASSAGEYVSKTASSIGTVNHLLDLHERDILANEHRINNNEVAIGHMQQEIVSERGDLRACQRFVVGHDEAIKRQDEALKHHDNDIKALQETVKTLQKAIEKLDEKNGKLQDENEKLQQKPNFQDLVIR